MPRDLLRRAMMIIWGQRVSAEGGKVEKGLSVQCCIQTVVLACCDKHFLSGIFNKFD
jgi:hypothetical protein